MKTKLENSVKKTMAILLMILLIFLMLPAGALAVETAEDSVITTQGENELPLDIFDEEPVWGDINDDNSVDAIDALQALRHAVHQIYLTGDDYVRGNVNKDDAVDSLDGLLILQFSVGLIANF